MLQTADAALQETQDVLGRMVELTTQAANDTHTDADRRSIQDELDQLNQEVDRIAYTCLLYTSGAFKRTWNSNEHSLSDTDYGAAGISGVSRTDAAVSGDKADLRRGSQLAVISGHDRGRDFAGY